MIEVYIIDILCKTSEISVEYCAINDDFFTANSFSVYS